MAMQRTGSVPESIDTNLECSTEQPDLSTKQRRPRRCAGCHEDHASHSWGIPGPNCQGRTEHVPLSQPGSPTIFLPLQTLLNSGRTATEVPPTVASGPSSPLHYNSSTDAITPSEKQPIEDKLRALTLEQEELEKLADLRAKLAQKEAKVIKLRQASNLHAVGHQKQVLPQQPTATTTSEGATFSTSTLRLGAQSRPSQAPFNASLQDPQTLQHLLHIPQSSKDGVSLGPGFAWQAEISAGHPATSSLHERFAANSESHSNMFLAAVPQGERVLRIVDFLSSIVPKESEKTLTDVGGSRLVISYGQQRPRLESVTLSQWVVANTRIFHHLLFANKLPTSRDLRDYLAYTVKIMELAGKYEWVSVLKFDDEYRQLQATYSFPWSHDSHHLHEVTLVPMARSKPPISQQPPQHAVPPRHPPFAFSTDHRVICRNCNSKGCHMQNCSYAHVCSQKFKGKVCSGSHPATQHSSLLGPSK